MKKQRKATVAAIAGLAGLVMMGTQSLAAGAHGTVGPDKKSPLAHKIGRAHV